MLKKSLYVLLVLFLLLLWFSWPVYQFYAHKGKVDFLFAEQLTIKPTSPVSQQLYNKHYQNAASVALTKLVSHHKAINAPAISAAVGIDGELVWAAAAGWADVKNAIALSTNNQFRVGSTSKAITATGLARLMDKKLIDLDAPIDQYHKSLPNPQWQTIKVKHLASHMAGLPHYKQFEDKIGLYQSMALNTYFSDVDEALAMFDQTKLKFTPGSDFSYSTYGTVLLSAVMQAAAGQPFIELMQQQVFHPAKLELTGAESEFVDTGNLTKFYWNNRGKNSLVSEWRDVDLSHRLAGGGFVSTSSDLVRLGNAYFDKEFISQANKQQLWTPQRLSNGQVNPQHYAIGWRVHQVEFAGEVVTYIHHGGVSRGAQSFWLLIPKYQLSMAININANTQNFVSFAKIWKDIALVFIQDKSILDSH